MLQNLQLSLKRCANGLVISFKNRRLAATCEPKRKFQDSDQKRDNLTAVLKSCGNLVLEQRAIPKVDKSEVLLSIDCVGICSTDLDYWKRGRVGICTLRRPLILGHEATGVVERVGDDVQCLKVGDRVAIEPGVPCRKCAYCVAGKYNLCRQLHYCDAPPHRDGTLTRYYRHRADFCFKLPNNVTMEEGALLQQVACGCAACRRAQVSHGMNVLILGAGPLGLATTMVARSLEPNQIMVVDLKPDRLKIAKELGAAHTLRAYASEGPKDLAKRIVEAYDCMPEVTIDCCGTVLTALLGAYVTKSNGTFSLIGADADDAPVSLIHALAREIRLVGSSRYCNDYTQAVLLVINGRLPLKRLITHHFQLEEIDAAFQTAYERRPGTMKVLVHPQLREENNPLPFDQKSVDNNNSNNDN